MASQGDRNAAEALLLPSDNFRISNSDLLAEVNIIQQLEQQLSSTHNSLSSLEGIRYEEVGSGSRINGKMSVVRRFFCLFVLFDLLLVSLIWLICIVLQGHNSLLEILKMQILHYSINSSLFDIVLSAICRFVVLLIFYGFLQLSTTVFVALTTMGTCVFLIFKIFYFSWTTTSQYPIQVTLIIVSFIIVWGEAWFLDFRVLPQEFFASTYVQSTGRFSESLSTLLLDRNLRSPVIRHFLRDVASRRGPATESNGDFYSPPESVNVSDDETGERKPIEEQWSNEYIRMGKDNLEIVWSLLTDSNWKLQKSSGDDFIYSKHESNLGKIFLLRTKINIRPVKLLEELFVNVERLSTWNKMVLKSRRIQLIDSHTDITYQVSAPGGNGLISSRDFINLRHWDLKGDCFVLAALSIPYPSLPPTKQYVRGENGPSCWAFRSVNGSYRETVFEFLLNTDIKVRIPNFMLEKALVSSMLEYSAALKEHCKALDSLEGT